MMKMTIDLSLRNDLNRSKKETIREERSLNKFDLEHRLSSFKQAIFRKKINFKTSEVKFSSNLEKLRSKYDILNQGIINNKNDKACLNAGDQQLGKNDNVVIFSDGLPKPKVVIFPAHMLKMKWQNSGRIGPGLTNLRNTCFLNATLQCLTYTPPLANYFLTLHHSETCKEVGFCVMCELQNHVIRALQQPNNETIRPMVMVSRIKYIGKQFQIGHQEDAHELLCCLKDVMQKNCLAGLNINDKRSKETTIVQQIFGGYYRSRVNCNSCHGISDVYEPFLDVTLDIKNSSNVFKALSRLIQPEKLEGENRYMCKTCGIKVTASKRLTIHKLPNILCLVFKRFDYEMIYGRKINKHISFSEIIEMSPYTSNYKGEKATYSLYAVLVHQGVSCHSGHYYSYVKAANGFWYKMDDSSVSQASLKEVLKQEAYILFYTKNDSQNKTKSPLVLQNKKRANQLQLPSVELKQQTKSVTNHPLVPYTQDSSDSSSDTSDYDNIVAQVSGLSSKNGSKSEQAKKDCVLNGTVVPSIFSSQKIPAKKNKAGDEDKPKISYSGEDRVQVSPSITSIASDNSCQSLCSTGGEWVVSDRKDQFLNDSQKEYSHPGWKVEAQNEILQSKNSKNGKKEKQLQSTNKNVDDIKIYKDREKNHGQSLINFKFKDKQDSSSTEDISDIKDHKKCKRHKQHHYDTEHSKSNHTHHKNKHEIGEIQRNSSKCNDGYNANLIFPKHSFSPTSSINLQNDKVIVQPWDWPSSGEKSLSKASQLNLSWDSYRTSHSPKENLNGSHKFYEQSWPNKSKMDHCSERKLTEKRNYDEYDKEYDKGKLKKIKVHHQSDNSYFTDNKFQKIQNSRNHYQNVKRKGSSKI